eukprot:TRINITY_DN3320_c0_g2_i3.p2 TRINITY_DN3320_c0_g2~~TRINITY_DN3320_c0_g2_i3.p2  ORF type:complete len:218 (+),score=33.40 TRINITY_DN3320_c0_g2_i3:1209-1862(+)
MGIPELICRPLFLLHDCKTQRTEECWKHKIKDKEEDETIHTGRVKDKMRTEEIKETEEAEETKWLEDAEKTGETEITRVRGNTLDEERKKLRRKDKKETTEEHKPIPSAFKDPCLELIISFSTLAKMPIETQDEVENMSLAKCEDPDEYEYLDKNQNQEQEQKQEQKKEEEKEQNLSWNTDWNQEWNMEWNPNKKIAAEDAYLFPRCVSCQTQAPKK